MSKQVTFRGVAPDEWTVRQAWALSGRLERLYGSLEHCNVVVLRDDGGRSSHTRYRVAVHVRAHVLDRGVSVDVVVHSVNLCAGVQDAFERSEHTLGNRCRPRGGRQRTPRAA